MKKELVILIIIPWVSLSQVPLSLSQYGCTGGFLCCTINYDCPSCYATFKSCVDKVKVGNERPSSCWIDADVWYPVIVENFNYTEELLNNYTYHFEDVLDDRKGKVWFGDALTNGNFYCQNGELILEIKRQDVQVGSTNYKFTGAMLNSLYKTKLGIYRAKIKFPDNIYMWPSFWLQYGAADNHDYEEIDWCEFFDNCPGKDNIGCGKGGRYHWLRMGILSKEPCGTDFCSRANHINMADNFFQSYHEYGGNWTNYKIEFVLDGNVKGVATKYSGTHRIRNLHCDAQRPIFEPKYCSNMMWEPECLEGIFNWCTKWNWVYKDVYFPHRPLKVFITCSINGQDPPDGCPESAYNSALHNWSSFNSNQKQTKVDYLWIYQPIKCYRDLLIANENAFKYVTGGTNFLSGRKITISDGWANTYINESPKASNNWHEFPTHILATEEIAFLHETIFEEGTFLRAEIINCSGNTVNTNLSERTMPNGDPMPPVLPIDYFDNDSSNIFLNMENNPTISQTDNGAIQIFPNPTTSQVYIGMPEEDFNDLQKIELVNVLGETISFQKSSILDLSNLPSGMYYLKFYFSSGIIVVKNIVKTD